MKVAFCRTLIENSHASFSHQSMSFKQRGRDEQQRLFVPELREAVLTKFNSAVREIAASADAEQPRGEGVVHLGDSRCVEKALSKNQYTTVLTSPPYPNRMSYVRELRPYMYWLGYLTNGRAAGELDWQAIGGTWGCATSNLGTWDGASAKEIPYTGFERLVRAITRYHTLLGRYVHKYFIDMQEHILSLRHVVASAGRCYYIVGKSKCYGTLLPVQDIYAGLFEEEGFKKVRVVPLRKRNSKKELYEYVVCAERSLMPVETVGLEPPPK